MSPPSATCGAAARNITASGKSSAKVHHPQPMRHLRQSDSQPHRLSTLRVVATTTIAARLGPRLQANISTVASQESRGLTVGDNAEQAQDPANVNAK